MTANLKTLQPGDPAYLAAAFELVGLKEIVGSKDEPKIVAFFAEAGQSYVKDDETAWCAAFAHAMLAKGGIKGTGMLNARSYMQWGTATTAPKRGDIAVFKRGNSSWQGHVAFFLFEDGAYVWVLGGNQSNSVSVARQTKASLLGYRRPPKGVAAQVEAKPRPAAPTATAKAAASAELTKAVQAALIEKGYPEVGLADGKYGSKTRGAILAFEADHALPLTGLVTAELWEGINAAETREVAPSRAEGKPQGNAALKASTGNLGVGGVLGGTAILGFADPLVKSIEGGAGLVYRVKAAFEPIIDLWPLLALIAAGLVIFFAWRSRRAVIQDFQTGKLTR